MVFDEIQPKIYDSGDSIGQSLNNLLLILKYGDDAPFDQLPEVKELLQKAFIDYENLLSFVHQKKVENRVKEYLKKIVV